MEWLIRYFPVSLLGCLCFWIVPSSTSKTLQRKEISRLKNLKSQFNIFNLDIYMRKNKYVSFRPPVYCMSGTNIVKVRVRTVRIPQIGDNLAVDMVKRERLGWITHKKTCHRLWRESLLISLWILMFFLLVCWKFLRKKINSDRHYSILFRDYHSLVATVCINRLASFLKGAWKLYVRNFHYNKEEDQLHQDSQSFFFIK